MITDDTIPVLGYKVYANTGRNEPLALVTETIAQVNSILYDSVINGEQIEYQFVYRFSVSAFNFNGEGHLSPLAELKSCTGPSQLMGLLVVVPGLSTRVVDL